MVLNQNLSDCDVVIDIPKLDHLVSEIKDNVPNIVIIDYERGKIDWEALYNLLKTHDKMGVLLLMTKTDFTDEELIDLVSKGIKGFIQKNSPLDIIIKAIERVKNGELWIERGLFSKVVGKFISKSVPAPDIIETPLTRREREIVALVIRGYKNKNIAKRLHITESTVKSHLVSIFRKLGIKNRNQLT